MKKTVFSKLFFNNIIIITASFLVLTIVGGMLIGEAVTEEKDLSVKNTAHTIGSFIGNGIPRERLEHFLYGISQSSKNSILLVAPGGDILLASVDDQVYNRDMRKLPMNECVDVFKGEEVKETGNLGGVYTRNMINYKFPYYDGDKVAMAVFISVRADLAMAQHYKLLKTLVISSVSVILLAFVLSYAFSKQISKPIREIGGNVKKVSKGELSSRVNPKGKTYNIREIRELADNFNEMAFHVEKTEELRNNFISDVSHELRTPMTTIGGFVDGILDGTIPPERQSEYLAIVKDEVSRLSALVNTFLEVARTENKNHTVELSEFDMNEVVRRTVINLESLIVEKEIYVDIIFETDPCFVKADKKLIKSVMNNLMENAIKFTNSKGKIRVSEKIRQNEVFISVYNTGCGIAENDKPFIFERFFKADKSRSTIKGTGIGLYIVKDILNRHGKNITVESEEGKFAEFTFSLDRIKD